MRRPTRPSAALTRRAVLTATAALGASLVAAACTPTPSREPDVTPTDEPDADAAVRGSVAAAEAEIIARYDATIATHPGLASALAPLRAEHAQHAEAMGVPIPSATSSEVPTARGQALAALIEAEQQAVAMRTSACEACADAGLARTTALIAASEAGHAEFLRGVT